LPTFLALCWWGDFSAMVAPSAGDVIVGGVKNTDQDNFHEIVRRIVKPNNPFLNYDLNHFLSRHCPNKRRLRTVHVPLIEGKQQLRTQPYSATPHVERTFDAGKSRREGIQSRDHLLQSRSQI
jgi:hypothetical protein